jgi:hypothetical protein
MLSKGDYFNVGNSFTKVLFQEADGAPSTSSLHQYSASLSISTVLRLKGFQS